jgi:aspartate/methionine/tyrosine aminotransferase/methylase of polypeptide subunit release factors
VQAFRPPDELAFLLADGDWGRSPDALALAAETFAAYCALGGNAPYLATKTLHALLRPEDSRTQGLALVRELAKGPGDAHFRLETLAIEIAGRHHSLRVVVLPSIFSPEDWGYTFLEGLLRRPLEDYDDKALVEVGAGSGWISIALAKFSTLRRIVGLDLNPRAVVVSEVNAILNSYDEAGLPLYDRQRRLLFERCEFQTSNLLSEVIRGGWQADYIIGCIPQVLSPDDNLDLSGLSEYSDAKTLGDLGNYCALQGVYEDQFGLGLIATALEESIRCLKRDGRIILNLAGRPGDAVIRRMFTRRGFAPQVIWRSRIRQASDTNIEPLVALERRTGVEFQFFMGRASTEPISAATARELREAGGDLWHDLLVYEARMVDPVDLHQFDQALGQLGLGDLKREIDLSEAGVQPLAFAHHLANALRRSPRLPYIHEAGSPAFRDKLASYLARQYKLGYAPDDLFLGPQREQVVFSLLSSLCNPGDRLLVTRNLASRYRAAALKAGVHLTVGNDSLDELERLAATLQPRVILAAVGDRERRNAAALRRIVSRGDLILDESDHLRLEPDPAANEVLEALARDGGLGAAIVLAGWSAGAPEGFDATIVMSPDRELHRNLMIMAETTYSRVSWVVETALHKRLEDALAFQIVGQGLSEPASEVDRPVTRRRFSDRIIQANDDPAFAEGAAEDERVIRLDYGENELPIPARLVRGLLKGVFEIEAAPIEPLAKAAISAYVLETRRVAFSADELVLGQGVIPLLSDAMRVIGRRSSRPQPRIAMAAGYYGVFPPLIQLAGGVCERLVADPSLGCKIDVGILERLPSPPDALLLVNPGNPSGVYYERSELLAIARYAVARGVWILNDEVFGVTGDPSHFTSLASLEAEVPGLERHLLSFGGLSKEFAAGGLRLGFVAGREAGMLRAIAEVNIGPVDAAALRATETLLGVYRRNEQGRLLDEAAYRSVVQHLEGQRRGLAERFERLRQVLAASGLEVPAPREGGLFATVAMEGWGDRYGLSADEAAAALLSAAGLRVNPPDWLGLPGHVRMVFALEERRFQDALGRIERFGAGWPERVREPIR